MKKEKIMGKEKIIAVLIIIIFVGVISYFFFSTSFTDQNIPSYVTGEKREIYLWASTSEGKQLLEQIPCYCGCKYDGHLHARHCFWRDDGSFDKHGITCSVCLDIAKKAKAMSTEGKDVCTIRKTIDSFYLPNKHLSTETPMPQGCAA